MKAIIYTLLFAVVALQASCSEKKETEMHSKLHYIITGEEKDDSFFYLYATDTLTNDTILLDKLGMPVMQPDSTFACEPLPRREPIALEMGVPIRYDMVGYTLQDSSVYVALAFWGKISLREYRIAAGSVVQCRQYPIDRHHLLSVANFGHPYYHSQIERIDDALYMYINGGQAHFRVDALYTFPLADNSRKEVQQLIFGAPERCVFVYRLREGEKTYYKTREWQAELTEREWKETGKAPDPMLRKAIEREKIMVEVAKKHLDKSYYLRELPVEDEARRKTREDMWNVNLDSYYLFQKDKPEYGLDSVKLSNARPVIEEVLTFCGLGIDIQIEATFLLRSQICFLYRQEGELKALFYSQGSSEWTFRPYKQEPVEPKERFARSY